MKRTLALFLAVAMCFSLAAPPVSAAQEDGSAASSSYVDESASASSSGKADASSAQEPEHSDASASASASASSSAASSSSASAEAEPEQRPEADRSAEAQDPEDSSEQTEQPSVPAEEDEEPEWPADDEPENVRTIRKSLKTVDGVRYTFTLTCGEDAGIPDNAKLSIVELNQALTEEELEKKENKKRPFDTERFVSEKALEQDSFDLRQGLKVRKKDYVFFTKFLDLSLTADGKKVQPKAPVTVTLETDAVEEGASGALEAAFYDKTATKQWRKEREKLVREQKEQLRNGELKQEDAKRFPERVFTPVELTNETEQDKGVKLSFQLEEFDRLGVTGVVKRLKSWKVKGERVCVYGPRSLKAKVTRESLKTPKAGLEKLRAFSVEPDEQEALKYDVTFWVGGTPERYEQTDGQLTAMDADGDPEAGVVACELKSSGKAGHTLIGTAGTDAPVAIKPGKRVGLLWDTGLREQSVEADKVSVEGMLPKNAQLTANDMLWRYSRPGEVVADVSGDAETLAAYDITISGRRGEFQPDEGTSVSVSIRDEAISSKKQLELWHLKDDGSVDIIRDFTVKGDTLSFDAEGFSVYMVVQITKEQVLTAGDGNQYKITVTYDSDAGIPEDAQLRVSELTEGKEYDKYVKKAAKKLDRKPNQLDFAHAFDIALVDPATGEHCQPAKPVKVSVRLLSEELDESDSLKVVHFGEKTEVLESEVKGESVEFQTDGFSVYVVAREALLQRFVFLNDLDGNLTESNWEDYVHSEQSLVDGEMLVLPADAFRKGSVFDHWSETPGGERAVIPRETHIDEDAVRAAVAAQEDKAAEDVNHEDMELYMEAHPTLFYAVYSSNIIVVTYYNQSGLVVEEQAVDLPAPGQPDVIYDTTKVHYTPIQDKEGAVLTFNYWTDDPQGAGAQVGENQDGKIAISASDKHSHLELYPNITSGHYIYFDTNKNRFGVSSADFTAAESVADGNTLSQVLASLNGRANHAIPRATGYKFTGWYIRSSGAHDYDEDANTKTIPVFYPNEDKSALLVNESEYNKLLNSGNLPNNPTLYAHWKSVPDSSYTIVVWGQNVDDPSKYDYVEGVTVSPARAGSGASTTFNGRDYAAGLDSAEYPEYQSEPVRIERNSNTVAADGSTVVNIYYDRREITITFKQYGTQYTYTETSDTSGTQYGLVNGNYVQLTRGTGTTAYSYSRKTYTQYNGTANGDYYIIEDGTYSTSPVTLYNYNGAWYKSRSGILIICYSNPYNGEVYTLNSGTKAYTGQRYTKSRSSYTATNANGANLYGVDENGNYVKLDSTQSTSYAWSYNGTPYTGQRYIRSRTQSSQWYTYKTITGLYGQTFSDVGVSWPTAIGSKNFSWYENGHGIGGNFGTGSQDTDRDGKYDTGYDYYGQQHYIYYQAGETSGMQMTFMDAFLPSENTNQITFYGRDNSSTTAQILFYKQNTARNSYEQANVVNTGSGSFSITDKYNGFRAESYQVDGGGSWTTLPDQPDAHGYYYTGISYTSKLEIRFKRREYNLKFNPMGGVLSAGETRSVAYGASLSGYPMPTPEPRAGYRFTGWYYDEMLTKEVSEAEYNSLTMPFNNLIFYAGWVPMKNRILLLPEKGQLTADQGTQFHLEQNEKIGLNDDPTRDYIPVESGTGTYTYNESTHHYEMTAQNDGDYSAKAGAYKFLGWYEADMGDETPKEIVYGVDENGKYKYAKAYGNYQKQENGPYHLESDGTYTYVGRGGDHAFVNSSPRKDANGEYILKNHQYNLDLPPEGPVILVARWQRAGSYRVIYNVEDPDLPADTDFSKTIAPEDVEEYLDGAHAKVLPAINAPEGYTLDYWTDQNWSHEGDTAHEYRPNSLVAIGDHNASTMGDEAVVILKAHYRVFNPVIRNKADYVFKTWKVNDAGTDFANRSYKVYEKQTVSVGEELKAPQTPDVPEGWRFRGWYYDTQGTYRFDGFGIVATPITTTVYAIYDKVYTVTYYLTDVSDLDHPTGTVLATQTYSVDPTQKLDSRRVKNPVDADHYVVAWVKSTDWANREILSTHYPYNSMTGIPVTGNLELYAMLRTREYVKYDANGGMFNGSSVETQEIPYGGRPVRPSEPIRTGFEFSGWYTSATGGTEYEFDEDLNTTNYPGYNGTLYAHWDAITDAKGKLHVIFWAQTADRPEDDEAAKDPKYYQMIHRTELEDVSLGSHTAAELASDTRLSGFVSNNQFDIVQTVQTGWNEEGGDHEGSAGSFVKDVLGYKGNDTRVNKKLQQSGQTTAYLEAHISELSQYFSLSDTSDVSVTVDGESEAVLNVRFDLKTFHLQFDHGSNATVYYKGAPYPTSTQSMHQIKIWLNRPIPETQWPLDRTGLDPFADGRAYLLWRPTNTVFICWDAKNQRILNQNLQIDAGTVHYSSPMKISDKLVIDSAIAAGGALTLTTNQLTSPDYQNTAVVHYLTRIGNSGEFEEQTERRVVVKVPKRPDWTNYDGSKLPKTEGDWSYSGFKESVCYVHGGPFHHNEDWYLKYAYNALEPGGLSGYTIIDNESGHRGELYDANGNPLDGIDDGKNKSPYCNLILSNLGRAQIIFDKQDITYRNYFANHPDQYVDEAPTVDANGVKHYVYNLYFYYKPLEYTLDFYTDPATQYRDGNDNPYTRQVFCGENLASILNSVPAPKAPDKYHYFAGWAAAPLQTSPSAVYTGTKMPSQNLTLYAIWAPVTHNVTTLGVDEQGTYFQASTDEATFGKEVDEDGNLVENGRTSAVYTLAHGRQLKELQLKNPTRANYLFLGWKDYPDGGSINSVFTVERDLVIQPDWQDLTTRRVTYNAAGGQGTVPVDNNRYIIGAKVTLSNGKGLTFADTDILGRPYVRAFAFWQDQFGVRYYPNSTYTFRTSSPEVLELKAIYSEYRETMLTYHKSADDAKFVCDDGTFTDYAADKLTTVGEGDNQEQVLRVVFLDKLNEYAGANNKIPNQYYRIAEDQDGIKFTLTRTVDGVDYELVGWATSKDATTAYTLNGDLAYVNTIKESSNHLYAVWGICKVVDLDGVEHVFDKIQNAVNFIQNNGVINGKKVGRLENKTGKVEMLVDYTMGSTVEPQVTIPADCTVTLSTAGKLGSYGKPRTAPEGERLFYKGTGERATIIRGSGNAGSLFVVKGSFTTEKIILDGGAKFDLNKWDTKSGWPNTGLTPNGAGFTGGGIAYVAANAALTIGKDTVMQNSDATYSEYKKGGAVYCEGTVTVSGDASEGKDSVLIQNCKADEGGGIYTTQAELTVSNATFKYCCVKNGGGGIRHENKSESTKTIVSNCWFDRCYSSGTENKKSGSGIRTNTAAFTLTDSNFTECKSGRQGGAVYHYPKENENTTGTTTHISGCSFSHCEAGYQGANNQGAGGALEAGAADVDIIFCTFTDCKALSNAGAVNIYNTNAEIALSDCSFLNCSANLNNSGTSTSDIGFGGAFRTTGKKTNITDCTFENCHASKGGAICCNGSSNVTTITMTDSTKTMIKDCTAKYYGGALFQLAGTLKINSGNIQNCSAPNGGAIYQGGGTFNFEGGTISGCSAANVSYVEADNKLTVSLDAASGKTYNGGGVYLGNGTFKMEGTGGTISQCKAVSSGGGVYLGGGKFTMSSGLIDQCVAKTGGGVSAHSGAIMTINKTGDAITNCRAANVSIQEDVATATDLHVFGNHGGGIYLDGGTPTINSTIRSCSAYDGGGLYLGGRGTLVMGTDASVITDCTAANSGAGIYQSEGNLTINRGKLKGNRAAESGGGIYLGGGTLALNGGTIGGTTAGTGNTAANGGGIYQGGGTLTIGTQNGTGGSVQGNVASPTSLTSDDGFGGGIYLGGGSFTLNSGSIGVVNEVDQPEGLATGGNQARKGGGLFVGNGDSGDEDKLTKAHIAGGVIGGNFATEVAGGGGIAIGGPYVRLYFSGNIQVWGNTMTPSTEAEKKHQKRCDVCLSVDSNDVIWTTDDGLVEDSHIGVYVTDDTVQGGEHDGKQLHKDLHGMTDMRFGTHAHGTNSRGTDNLSRFINNRSGTAYDGYEYYYGVCHPDDPDYGIYWARYICEITDENENLLFTNSKATAPALYQYLGKYGAFEALQKGQKFYTRNKTTGAVSEYTAGKYYVRMLVVDYSLQWDETVTVPAKGKIWLMMADDDDTNLSQGEKEKYSDHDGCVLIQRGKRSSGSMFTTAPGSDFTLTHVTLDGGATYDEDAKTLSGTSVSANGGLIKAGGTLTLDAKSVLQNSLTTGGGGAIAVDPSTKNDFTITVKSDAKIWRCKAENGGMIYVNHSGKTVTFDNQGTIRECTATNGGYLYVDSGTLILKGVFTGGKATNGGGAYVKHGILTFPKDNNGTELSGCTATTGGGVYVDSGVFNCYSGSVTSNSAEIGGGVYVNSGKLNLNGRDSDNPQVRDNTASQKGGGIAFGGETAVLELNNRVTVTGNTMTDPKDAEKTVACNIYLDCDSNNVIQARSALTDGSQIGVYASDDALTGGETVRSKHGTTGKPFGTWYSNNPQNLQCFVNDRSKFLYGTRNNADNNDTKIYWVTFICKITTPPIDEDGTKESTRLLYRQLDDGSYSPAVYAQLGQGANSYNKDCAFNTLMDNSKPLYKKNDDGTYTAYTTNDYWIQMLVPAYTWRKYINVNKKVTFTTASTTEDEEGFCYPDDDEHPYATILRSESPDNGSANSSMFTVRGSMTLMDIIIDGRNLSVSNDGALIQVKNENASRNASVTIGENATLKNGCTTGKGGAVYAEQSGQTINVTGGTITGNIASTGAGIYAGNGVTLNLSGSPSFGGTDLKGGTGEDQENLKGEDGNFVLKSDTETGKPYVYTSTDADKPKNGGKVYPTDADAQKYLVRQDIYLPGNADTLNTLHVTGRLTDPEDKSKVMPAGSIWVWAEDAKHYKSDKQFAIVDSDYKNQARAAELDEVMKAFRNAQDDKSTENPNEECYLYGIMGTSSNVVWGTDPTGTVRVILKKVGSNHASLAGATFSILKKDKTTPVVLKKKKADGTIETISLENLTSGNGGVFFIGDLPYGTYYIKETGLSDTLRNEGYSVPADGKYFQLIVNEQGVVQEDGTDSNGKPKYKPIGELKLS